jgi:hypothetical protein
MYRSTQVEKVNREEKIVKAVPSRAETKHGKNKKTVPDEVEDEEAFID